MARVKISKTYSVGSAPSRPLSAKLSDLGEITVAERRSSIQNTPRLSRPYSLCLQWLHLQRLLPQSLNAINRRLRRR